MTTDFDRVPDFSPSNDDAPRPRTNRGGGALLADPTPTKTADEDKHVQWRVDGDKYRSTGEAVRALPSACYRIGFDGRGLYFARMPLLFDAIAVLPDSPMALLVDEIETFWASAALYRKFGLVYKRGILLWGPPGGGKTIAIALLARELIARDGVLISVDTLESLPQALFTLRDIEPTRSLIVILEDFDELIATSGESQILSVLDGETQTDNVVYIATTNYIERLGPRIANRPSRFDRRIYVGMPTIEQRQAYIDHVAVEWDVDTRVNVAFDTDGFAIAHIRELIVSTMCLGRPYSEVLSRLRSMMKRPNDRHDGYAEKRGIGLGV